MQRLSQIFTLALLLISALGVFWNVMTVSGEKISFGSEGSILLHPIFLYSSLIILGPIFLLILVPLDIEGAGIKETGFIFSLVIYVMIMVVLAFSALAKHYGLEPKVSGNLDYIYFSIVTFTTLGYGDFKPTDGLRIWASLHALLGYFFMAVFIGLILRVRSSTAAK